MTHPVWTAESSQHTAHYTKHSVHYTPAPAPAHALVPAPKHFILHTECTTHVYTACCTFITSHCTQSKVTWVGTQDGGGEMNLNSCKQSQMNISFGKQGVILWLHLTQEYNFNIVYKLCNTLLSYFVRSVLSPCLRVRPAAKATP